MAQTTRLRASQRAPRIKRSTLCVPHANYPQRPFYIRWSQGVRPSASERIAGRSKPSVCRLRISGSRASRRGKHNEVRDLQAW